MLSVQTKSTHLLSFFSIAATCCLEEGLRIAVMYINSTMILKRSKIGGDLVLESLNFFLNKYVCHISI